MLSAQCGRFSVLSIPQTIGGEMKIAGGMPCGRGSQWCSAKNKGGYVDEAVRSSALGEQVAFV